MENNYERDVKQNRAADDSRTASGRKSRNVDVAEARRRSGRVDVVTGKRLDGRVQVPVDRRRSSAHTRQSGTDDKTAEQRGSSVRTRQNGANGKAAERRGSSAHTRQSGVNGKAAERRGSDVRMQQNGTNSKTAERRRNNARAAGKNSAGTNAAAYGTEMDRPLTAREREELREAARRRRQEEAVRRDDAHDTQLDDRQDAGRRKTHGKKNKKSKNRKSRMTDEDRAVQTAEKEARRQEKEHRQEQKKRKQEKQKTEREKRRQVRAKKRQARLEVILRVSKVFGKILLAVCVCALTAFVFIRSFYKLEKIEVTGTDHYTDEQLTELVTNGKSYDNTLMFLLGCRLNETPEITFIDKVNIEYVDRNTISLTAYEKAMAGCIRVDGQYAYFDGDGIVLELSDEKLDDVPCIEGLECESVEQGSVLTVGDEDFFREILTMTQIIYKNDIEIDKIEVDDSGELLLYRGSIKIRLGDTDNLEAKLMDLEQMLAELEGKSGTLDLSAYDSTGGQATFKQK